MKNHFFSIGIVTYDRAEMLKEAVKSVLSQTYKNFEVIISNDNPKKKVSLATLGIKPNKCVRIINHNVNLGEAENLNFVLKASRGEYFSWLADDEVLYPQFLERCMLALNENEKDKISAVYPFYDSGEFPPTTPQKTKTPLKATLLDTKKLGVWYSENPTKIIGIYGLLHRKTLIQSGGFLKLGNGFGPYSDNLIPYKLSTLGDILILHEKMYFYRSHPAALSVASTDILAYWTAEIDFLNEIHDIYKESSPMTMRTIQKNLIKLFLIYSSSVLARGKNLRWPMKKRWFKHCFSNYPRPHLIFSNLWSILRQALFILSAHH